MSGGGPAGAAPSSRWAPYAALRVLLVLGGTALMATGVTIAVTSVPSRQWPSTLLWLAGGVAVHDLLLAPLAVGAGLLVLSRVPPLWRGPLRGAALGAGVLAVFAAAVLGGASSRRHESVVPLDPAVALGVAAGVLVEAVLLGALVAHLVAVRARRRARRSAGTRSSGR